VLGGAGGAGGPPPAAGGRPGGLGSRHGRDRAQCAGRTSAHIGACARPRPGVLIGWG
jgi:hypothetical protein